MSDFWSSHAAVLNILVFLIMQLEHVFVKSCMEELCAGAALHLSLHEHPLYWRNFENKGFVECSVFNEGFQTQSVIHKAKSSQHDLAASGSRA